MPISAPDNSYHHKNLKKALLQSALEELREFGPSGISLRRIAQRAGVSHAAPYRHFQDKDDLLAALAWEGQMEFADCLRASREKGDTRPVERLFRLGLAYLEFARARPAVLQLMFSETGLRVMAEYTPADIEDKVTRYDSFGVLEETVKECQADGTLDRRENSGALAVLIWSFVHGYAVIKREGFTRSMGASRGLSGDTADQLVMNAFRGLILGGQRSKKEKT